VTGAPQAALPSDAAQAGPPTRRLVAVDGATVRLGGRDIWSDVSMSVAAGEFVALLGPNGAGKSTLLKAVLGLQALSAGHISVLGGAPGRANTRIGYLPQRHGFDAGTRLRGRDLVRLGLDGARWGVPLPVPTRAAARRRRDGRRRIDEVIEQVGAQGYAHRPIGRLSGGEQQRLLIAQALVRSPKLLILDEPFDSLDLANQSSAAALLQRLCRDQGVAVLLVAHDVNPLLAYLDEVVYLAGGHAVQGPVSEVINARTLSSLYGAPIEVLRARDGRLVVVGQPEAPFDHGDRHAAEEP
jgi:zinc/manganese transport system ATP-binding protein